MDLEEIRGIPNEAEQVNRIYDVFKEETRLTHSRAARVEFLTTTRYIEQYVKPGMRILDIGAGPGEYSFYFAEKGYEVDALELADANVRAFQKRMRPGLPLTLLQKRGHAVLFLYRTRHGFYERTALWRRVFQHR